MLGLMRPALVLERQATLAVRVLIVGALFAAAIVAFRSLQPIVLPFLFALLLSALLAPLVDVLGRHMRHGLAVTVVLTGFLVLLFGTLAYVIPTLFTQASDAVVQLEQGIEKIPEVASTVGLNADETQELLSTMADRLQENLGSISSAVSTGAFTIATLTVSIGFGMFLSLVLLVYMLVDGRGFWDGAVRLLDADRRSGARRSGIRGWHALVVFVRSQVLVALFDAVGIAIGLLALGVPLVLPLAVITFILCFIPYIGATLSGLIVALVALSTVGPGAMIAILIIAGLVQAIEGNVIYPVLVGRTLRLHPITVLLAVGVGSALLGVLGAFFATPILATVAAAAGFLPDPMTDEVEAPAALRADQQTSVELPVDDGEPPPPAEKLDLS